MRETYTDPLVLTSEVLCPEEIIWNEVVSGIETTEYVIEDYKVQWACVRIDLNTPGLKITATPQSTPDGKRYHADKMDLNSIAGLPEDSVTTSIVVNTTPFDMKDSNYPPVSIVKIDGQEICPMNDYYSALGLEPSQDGIRAAIIKNQNEEELAPYQYAFGGFFWILDEEEMPEFAKFKRSRTACGINEYGSVLYLFATCGINCPTGRDGLNFEECARILKELGCYQAMEFDGGHSTALTVNGKNLIKPSLQRKVPALLILYMVK